MAARSFSFQKVLDSNMAEHINMMKDAQCLDKEQSYLLKISLRTWKGSFINEKCFHRLDFYKIKSWLIYAF